MKKFAKISGLAFAFFLLGFLCFFLFSFFYSRPSQKGKMTFNVLSSDVRVVKDKWGVPHIFAQSEKDLFFAAGFVQAQERMWQMELTRKAGQGRLSEIFGKQTVERDKFLRNLGLRKAVLRDYENLTPKLKELLDSYADGVNSWMDTRKLNWPPEFLLLRYRPEPWTILDSLIIKEVMALLLCMDYSSESMRGKLVETLGAEKALEILEEGIVLPPLPEEKVSPPVEHGPASLFQGSNNWVLAGSRTKSGKPLLANDPHLEISLPPVWYEIHLQCPTLHVAGVTFPGVPLVLIGHNGSIAWGMTNSGADVQDLFIEKINESGDEYFDRDGWKTLGKEVEVIKVKGQKDPERLIVLWTSRGPLVSPGIIRTSVSLSLKWTIYEGGRLVEAVYRLNKAKNWQEFKEAVTLVDVPSQNFVYADVHGNIGYCLSGKIPVRPMGTALFPYPAWEGTGDWTGILEEEKKPNLFNPDEGYIVTANNKIIPEDYPYYVSLEWDVPFRADRIKELILGREKHDIESMKKIQNDVVSNKAGVFLPYILELRNLWGKSLEAQDLLKEWNREMSSGKEAALYAVFMNFFQENIFKDELGADFKRFDSQFKRKQAGVLRIIGDPSSSWFDDKTTAAVESREDIIRMSLEQAFEWLSKEHGSPEKWDWMKIHTLKYEHALGRVPLLGFFNKGKHPVDGDASCVRASFGPGYKTTHGASCRQIIDLGDIRNSISVLSSGQSGHFLSRHYGDQIPLWIKGDYHPMLFDREDIESQASGVLLLRAGKKKDSE